MKIVRLLTMRRRVVCYLFLGILVCSGIGVECKAAAKPDIVLITIDGARFDRIGVQEGRRAVTPKLDRLLHDSVYFSQAYAQAPSTVASNATILTGTYPQIHHASELGSPLPGSVPYLPDLLRAKGYKTAAFVGSLELDPQNGPFQAYNRGFDLYDAAFHSPRAGETRSQSFQRNADEVVRRAVIWLGANHQTPFFMWINFSDPDDAAIASSYDAAMASTDGALGKLLAALRSEAVYDNTVVAVVSDHGQGLGSHGEETHGIFLYDETIHVPLLLKMPQQGMAGKQVKNRVQLLDVAPTLLAAADVAVPPSMQGQSLLRLAQSGSQTDRPAYARADLPFVYFGSSSLESWRTGKFLYIRAPKPELYDLSADPGATHNLAQSSKATLETIAAQLQAFDSRLANDIGKDSSVTLSSTEMQKLASLGYVGLQKSGSGVKVSTEGVDAKDIIASANKVFAAKRELDDGKPEKALALLKEVPASQGPSYLAEFLSGSALMELRRYSDAIPSLHKAIELQPDSPFAHYAMGICLMKTGDFKSAAVHLEIAARRLPKFAGSRAALAEADSHSKAPKPATQKDRSQND